MLNIVLIHQAGRQPGAKILEEAVRIMSNPPLVSIIIPCRNEARRIGPCLDSVLANDYPRDRLEILVVDGASGDGTRDIVRRYSQSNRCIRLLENPKKITPVAFNIGIEHAAGEIIMIMSAHATYDTDYVSKCVRYLDEYDADNVGGIMITVPSDEAFIAKAIALALAHPFGTGNSYFRTGLEEPRWVDTVYGGCYKREVFKKVGLFNEELVRSQDIDFNMRLRKAGGKILLVPDIVAHYYYPKSNLGAFLEKNILDGFWATMPLKFGSEVFALRHLIPLAFASSLLASAALTFLLPFFRWLFLGIVLLYSSVSVYFAVRIAVTEGNIGYLLVMPIAFAARHVGYGLGSLYGLLRVLLSRQFWVRWTRTVVSKSRDIAGAHRHQDRPSCIR